MSYEEAVAVCDGAPTALTFLRDKAKLQPGQNVLINGASGAVGIYAVQIAKRSGPRTHRICSTANLELVKAHGADKVIDYTQEDFTKNGQTYDVIFDAVGKRSFAQCKGSLRKEASTFPRYLHCPFYLTCYRLRRSATRKPFCDCGTHAEPSKSDLP